MRGNPKGSGNPGPLLFGDIFQIEEEQRYRALALTVFLCVFKRYIRAVSDE